jgi:uncharacterized phiE125 gp8 family phage protein
MGRVAVVEAPAPIVTWAEANEHLKLDGDTSQQAHVEALIAAATAHIDGPDGLLGRAIGVQTLEFVTDGFGHGSIALPCRPIIDITSISYLDSTGAWQQLDSDAYELRGDELGTAWGKSWPSTRVFRGCGDAVKVRYRAGYEQTPAPIRVAILLMVDDLYRNRGNVTTGNSVEVPMPVTSSMLLQPFRVYA